MAVWGSRTMGLGAREPSVRSRWGAVHGANSGGISPATSGPRRNVCDGRDSIEPSVIRILMCQTTMVRLGLANSRVAATIRRRGWCPIAIPIRVPISRLGIGWVTVAVSAGRVRFLMMGPAVPFVSASVASPRFGVAAVRAPRRLWSRWDTVSRLVSGGA